jgi:tRNA modification GTPase
MPAAPSSPVSLARLNDPIVAIATAPGRGAVGMIRASGRDLSSLVDAICGRPLQPRVAHLVDFLDAQGQALDRGLALHFPAPNSYTGEEVLELQAHGGPVLLQLLLARCLEAGAAISLRVAEPGEFTARAFRNDKIDLAQAEAVADLIDASTEAAARSAGRSLAGAFSLEIEGLAERIVTLRMLVEATLDFPEEEIEFLERAGARARLQEIRDHLAAVRARARQGALLREGLRVVLAGPPNVGKSSLLNALAGAELAIVTPIPGTTRDRISETIQIHGVPVHVVDTAGLRETTDEVERLGIERSWQAIAEADAVLFLHDLTRPDDAATTAEIADLARRLDAAGAASVLHVYNKRDLRPDAPVPADALALSARTSDGLDALREALLERAGAAQMPEGVFIARTRHVQALDRTAAHLAEAAALADQGDAALDLFAEELRLAHDALGEITGRFTADDLLGEIFGRFCIGK